MRFAAPCGNWSQSSSFYTGSKKKYASFQTCHRYFQEWVAGGVFQEALLTLTEELTEELEEAGLLQLHESFLEGCFVPAKKGAIVSA